MVLTQKKVEGKLEEVDPTQRGKRPCKRHSELLRENWREKRSNSHNRVRSRSRKLHASLRIADRTLHHWCQLFSQQGEQAFPGSGHQPPQEEEMRQGKREHDLLRQERDSLKKARGIFSRRQLW